MSEVLCNVLYSIDSNIEHNSKYEKMTHSRKIAILLEIDLQDLTYVDETNNAQIQQKPIKKKGDRIVER